MSEIYLNLVNRALGVLGVEAFSSLATSTNRDILQINAMAKDALDEILRYDWSELLKEFTLSTVIGQSVYNLPDDFERFAAFTHWDQTKNWRLCGPVSPEAWSWRKSAITAVPEFPYHFRLYGANKIELDPSPSAAGHMLSLYYYANYAVSDADGALKRYFSDDGDTFLLEDELFTAALKYRYRKEKRLDYAAEQTEFYQLCDRKANKAAPEILNMGAPGRFIDPNDYQIIIP